MPSIMKIFPVNMPVHSEILFLVGIVYVSEVSKILLILEQEYNLFASLGDRIELVKINISIKW